MLFIALQLARKTHIHSTILQQRYRRGIKPGIFLSSEAKCVPSKLHKKDKTCSKAESDLRPRHGTEVLPPIFLRGVASTENYSISLLFARFRAACVVIYGAMMYELSICGFGMEDADTCIP
jgi:hypothetical protein